MTREYTICMVELLEKRGSSRNLIMQAEQLFGQVVVISGKKDQVDVSVEIPPFENTEPSCLALAALFIFDTILARWTSGVFGVRGVSRMCLAFFWGLTCRKWS